MDDHISKIGNDPRFFLKKKKIGEVPIEVDTRFTELKSNKGEYKDKRGRPWIKNPIDYVTKLIQDKKVGQKGNNSKEDSESDDESDDTSSKEASSDEDEDDWIIDDDNIEISEIVDADFASLVKDAPIRSDATDRLAVLHFDWDNSRSEDIYLLLQSFLPKTGGIKRVTIYPSQLGMERMAEEKMYGPRELRLGLDGNSDGGESSKQSTMPDEDDPAQVSELRKRMRAYQLARLKYFYAIVEFDSASAAASVYEQCDGMEYESSGVKLDLRFVDPSDTFEVPSDWSHLVHTCSGVDPNIYTPKTFETTALRATKLTVSWDETEKDRQEWFKKGFNVDDFDKDLDDDTVRRYVACSSDDEEEEVEIEQSGPSKLKPKMTAERARALLLGLGDDDGKSEGASESDREGGDLGSDDDQEEAKTLQETAKKPKYEAVSAIVSSDEEEGMDTSEDESDEELPPAKRKPGHNGKMEDKASDKKTKKIPFSAGIKSDGMDKKKKKLKRKAMMKEKLRKKKEKDTQKSTLWTDGDSRFDEFLTDPSFNVSSAHPEFKEAANFVKFMQSKRVQKGNSKKDKTID